MKSILFSLFSVFYFYTGIYSIPVSGINNTPLDLSDFEGKKILFVNIASSSGYVDQLNQLQELYDTHGDSLVIIAFPSNSFGNEPLDNTAIEQFCISTYGVSFPIAAKSGVTGSNKHPVYEWLTNQAANGVVGNEVYSDFQKFIINGEGDLIAVFGGSVPPDHPGIIYAITHH